MATEVPMLTSLDVARWLSGIAQEYFDTFTARAYGLSEKDRAHQIALAVQLTDSFARQVMVAALERPDVQNALLDLDALIERRRTEIEAREAARREREEIAARRKAKRLEEAKRLLAEEGA